MKKFLKSKLFIICAILAIVLALVPAVLAAFGQVDVVRSGLATVAKPFSYCGNKIAEAFDGFVSVFADYDALQKENEELRATIESMENQQADDDVLREENKWLREFLDLSTKNPDFELADADIISFEAGNYSTVLMLNKGSVHGIKKNMPVITSKGVIGYVSEVGLDWCRVTGIIETTSKVSAYTDRTGVIGTVEGDAVLRADGKCVMSCAPDAEIKPGDRVYTSGTGDIYPDGLLIGKIVSFDADDTTRRLIATIEPAVDFENIHNLGSVMIVTGYVGHTEEK